MLAVKANDFFIPSLESARKYIYSMDLSKIINKLTAELGWLKKDAEDTSTLYRNFLYLNKKYSHQFDGLTPSLDIDEFWHNHILDTFNYAKDCDAIFGKFFHHYPYISLDGETTKEHSELGLKQTQQLYYNEFQGYITATKSGYPKIVYYLMKKFFF